MAESTRAADSEAAISLARRVAPRIVALLCIACVVWAIFIAHRSPATGYESSIYTGTPFPAVWLLLLGLAGGVAIAVYGLFAPESNRWRNCLAGFVVITLSAVTFLCLPSIRNYVTASGGDQLGHVGFVVDILDNQKISGVNPYPVVHTLLAEVASVTGLSAMQVVNLNTAAVFIVFMLDAYLLATALLPDKRQRLLAALVAGGTMAGISSYYLVPNTWSIAMLPLFFCCYFRQKQVPFRILTVLLLLIYPFFHPLSSVVIMVALAAMELPKPLYSRLFKRLGMGVPSWMESSPVLWPLVLEAEIFFPWILTRQAFRENVKIFWQQLVSLGSSNQYQSQIVNLEKANVSGFSVLTLSLKMYGEQLIFLALAALAVILIVRQARSGNRDSYRYTLLLFGVWIPPALVIFLGDFAGLAVFRAFAAGRMLLYIEIACIPFAALALWEIARRARSGWLARAAVCSLLIMALVGNFVGHYRSPYLLRPNEQVTHKYAAGMTWYLGSKDPQIAALCVATYPKWYAEASLGYEAARVRQDLPEFPQVGDHFGYDAATNLGWQYSKTAYVSISGVDRVVYQTIWRPLDRWNDADFGRLEHDPTADRIYSNGETEVLFVTQRFGQ